MNEPRAAGAIAVEENASRAVTLRKEGPHNFNISVQCVVTFGLIFDSQKLKAAIRVHVEWNQL